jgi:hypothetical protein
LTRAVLARWKPVAYFNRPPIDNALTDGFDLACSSVRP